jgi:hypothetical protein
VAKIPKGAKPADFPVEQPMAEPIKDLSHSRSFAEVNRVLGK